MLKGWRKRYEAWVQARPRDEGSLYAALCKDCSKRPGQWLTNETTKKEAWAICEAHERSQHP
jgi:hypothetical protein